MKSSEETKAAAAAKFGVKNTNLPKKNQTNPTTIFQKS